MQKTFTCCYLIFRIVYIFKFKSTKFVTDIRHYNEILSLFHKPYNRPFLYLKSALDNY